FLHAGLCTKEEPGERIFMNVVLFRLLFAQGLVEGAELGPIGESLADPRGDGVDVLLYLRQCYPQKYPLTPGDIKDIEDGGTGLGSDVARMLDDAMIIPGLSQLYRLATGWLCQPSLAQLEEDGRPIYPDSSPAAATRATPSP